MQDILDFVDGLLESSTPQKPAWNIEQALEKKEPRWNYVDGCMIKALLDLYYAAANQRYLDFAESFIDFYIDESGNIRGYDVLEYNCDHINEGKVLFDLYAISGKEKYKKAIDLLYSQLLTHPRTSAGSFWHKKIYPEQVWLDGLYMVQPFYMEYEMLFNNKRNYKDIFNQFKIVYDTMRDASNGLFYHGYDHSRKVFWADKETGLSKNFWTRSIGWYTMALVDTIEKLDEQLFFEYNKLQLYLRDALDALLSVIDKESRMFYQVTDAGPAPGNYLETSGTCAVAYSLMKGARLGYLPTYYYEYGYEIFSEVVRNKLTLDDGKFVLKDICLVAGLGGMPGKGDYKLRDGTFEYYVSEPRVDNDAKGVAPFLFAYAELCRK